MSCVFVVSESNTSELNWLSTATWIWYSSASGSSTHSNTSAVSRFVALFTGVDSDICPGGFNLVTLTKPGRAVVVGTLGPGSLKVKYCKSKDTESSFIAASFGLNCSLRIGLVPPIVVIEAMAILTKSAESRTWIVKFSLWVPVVITSENANFEVSYLTSVS